MFKEKKLELEERKNNFKEVHLGLTEEEAFAEAERCLNCRNPRCVEACPTNQKVPLYIKAIAERKYNEALEIILQDNPLPAVCGRICPASCEKACIQVLKGESISIRLLKRFVADKVERKIPKIEKTEKRIAVIGSGPAGLSAAYYLTINGYSVDVFESRDVIGGALSIIPEFRLPKEILNSEINYLKKLGINFQTSKQIKSLSEFNDYNAVFISVGAWISRSLSIKGENLDGVESSIEFLDKVNNGSSEIGEKVIIIGGGNSAIDVARTAVRLGSKKVIIVYRRQREQMPASPEEIKEAEEEGIKFIFLAAPVEVIGKEKVEKLRCIKMKLGELDSGGRPRPVPIPNSEYEMEVDSIICAISQSPKTDWLKEIEKTKWGSIKIDKNGKTNKQGVWAGGDAVTGPSTVVKAIASGKKAARDIDGYLK